MSLVREPKNVDLYVIDKKWSQKEKQEFSDYLKKRLGSKNKSVKRTVKKNDKGLYPTIEE